MGHWERDADHEISSENRYLYKEIDDDRNPIRPTLLAAGLTAHSLIEPETTEVTVTMWPLVVHTKFTNTDPSVQAVEAKIGDAVVLAAKGTWNVEWTVKQGNFEGNGFTDLIKAGGGSDLVVQNSKAFMKNQADDSVTDIGLGKNVITGGPLDLGDVAFEGSVAFNLEYVPFNLTAATSPNWSEFAGNSKYFNLKSGTPVWIIRSDSNGYGAVRFKKPEVTVLVKPNEVPASGALMKFYVGTKIADANEPRGSMENPFPVIQDALNKVSVDYYNWSEADNAKNPPVEINLLEDVELAGGALNIREDSNHQYPPLVLSGRFVDPSDPTPMSEIKITLTSAGHLLQVGKNITLTLQGITLKGKTDNNVSLVKVEGDLIIGQGACITGNVNYDGWGGGVYVDTGGKLTIPENGGEISGNVSESLNEWNGEAFGGGVFVITGGTFEKSGGIIYGKGSGKSNILSGGDGYTAGDAVFVGDIFDDESYYYETTAGEGVNWNYTGTGKPGNDWQEWIYP
jgi:hypothetical protein